MHNTVKGKCLLFYCLTTRIFGVEENTNFKITFLKPLITLVRHIYITSLKHLPPFGFYNLFLYSTQISLLHRKNNVFDKHDILKLLPY